MKPKDAVYLSSKIINEGFEYAFVHYSEFKEIEDKEFHKERKEFLAARDKFFKWLEENGVETEE